MLKKIGFLTLVLFGTLSANAVQTANPAATTADEQTEMLRLSEAFGHFIGRNLNAPGMKFDIEAIIKGMRDGAAGKNPPMSDQEYESLLMKMQQKAFTELSEKNLKIANSFLEENKKQPAVVEIEPGKLQYTVLQQGSGETVGDHHSPSIHYKGTYIDGTVFGDSRESGGSVTIPLDQTVPGFSKGIVGMKEGEKRKLFVHPELGYGTMGQLPPNSLLIFEVEVIKADSPIQDQSAALDDDADSDDDSDDDSDEDNSK